MTSLQPAADALRTGSPILISDDERRENETDLVVAAEYATPERISQMRNHAGGFICLALTNKDAKSLGLRYVHELLKDLPDTDTARQIVREIAPYGDAPAFSIAINHRDVRTGITDHDRSKTIRALVGLLKKSPTDLREQFQTAFVAPGHVPLLIGAANGISERTGHTELSLKLAETAGVYPATVVCEMLDDETHAALSTENVKQYAKKNEIPFVTKKQIIG